MRKIRIIEKFEIASVSLMAICLLGAVICFTLNENKLEFLFYIFSFVFVCILFFLYIWASYLYDNLPKNEQENLAKNKNVALYDEALIYIANEKYGHITRFQRRYGLDIYERLVLEGYIYDYPNENKWSLKKREVFSL